MNRWIQIPSISNFRELGGLINREGKAIKHNILYRSGRLDIDIQECAKMEKLHIGCILDLRGEQEIADRPDTLVSNTIYKKISGIPGPKGAHQNLNFMKLINDQSSEEEILMYH